MIMDWVKEEESISNMQFTMPTELSDVLLPNDRVLIVPVDADDKTHGGLILDPRHRDAFRKGIVVLVGPGKLTEDETARIPMQLTNGDVVLYDVNVAKPITINTKTFNIFTESEGLIAKIGEVNKEGEIQYYVNTKI